MEMNKEGIALARRLGIRGWLLSLQQGVAGLAVWVGDWAEADRVNMELE